MTNFLGLCRNEGFELRDLLLLADQHRLEGFDLVHQLLCLQFITGVDVVKMLQSHLVGASQSCFRLDLCPVNNLVVNLFAQKTDQFFSARQLS